MKKKYKKNKAHKAEKHSKRADSAKKGRLFVDLMAKEIFVKRLDEIMQNHIIEPDSIDIDDLVDIRTVKIDTSLPADEQFLDLVRQTGDPFHYRYGDRICRIRYDEMGIPRDYLLRKMMQGKDFVQSVSAFLKEFSMCIDGVKFINDFQI